MYVCARYTNAEAWCAATIGPEAMSNTNAAIPTTLTDKALEFIVL